MSQVIVIGAGIGGLTTAAILAKAGLTVTVLEAHVSPGGCASTFYHQKYHFDAGATLAGGFYPGGPMELVADAAGIAHWPATSASPAMVVHLPDGLAITHWGNHKRHQTRRDAFGPAADTFWQWQERTADAMWSLATRSLPWPPQSIPETTHLLKNGLHWLKTEVPPGHLPQLMADAVRPVAVHLRHAPANLRLFIDGQLLIAAQTTSRYANALYGASALDLPRRGVVHLTGGMGTLAETLVLAIKQHGGQVLYKKEAARIIIKASRPVAVETHRGESFPADIVVANLPPGNIARLLGNDAPRNLRQTPPYPADGWGAFTTYVGLDGTVIPNDFPLHYQILVREPLTEGNSVFLSLNPAWDTDRAPAGQRVLTLSTHTALLPWWRLFETDPAAYHARKTEYTHRLLTAAEVAVPRLREAAHLILPGTPLTFQRFTRRIGGWVGGFPQTHLFRTMAPQLQPGLWMVGDSIFPGQSTAAVALGGMRVARTILQSQAVERIHPVYASTSLTGQLSSPTYHE